MRHRFLLLPALCLLLAACAVPSPRPQRADAAPAATRPSAPLILISLDGVHPDYLERGLTPALGALAADGVRAEWMTPSYPSLTFPNHYTIVTGLRPDRHGIVHNTMRDPALGEFTLANRRAVGDGRWWGGEPLWVTAQNAGLRTATMFWPGSEAAIGGVRPHWWHAFSYETPIAARVDRALGWLDLPSAERPRLVTLYFEHADKAGHEAGPDSPQLDAALREVDAGIARLVDGLKRRGLYDRTNIVIVSDHGMASTSIERVIVLDDVFDPTQYEVVTHGEVIGLQPRHADLAPPPRPHPHLACWRKAELPARWYYGRHPRVPQVVCQAEEGWKAITREALLRSAGGRTAGSHGYDPAAPSMRAIFLAHGPAFWHGAVVPAFDNVHVYPLLAWLIGVEPVPGDGDPAVLEPTVRVPMTVTGSEFPVRK